MAKRWRAKIGEIYFYFDGTFGDFSEFDVSSHREENSNLDLGLWEDRNYFKTRDDAVCACKLLDETLEKFHKAHSESGSSEK